MRHPDQEERPDEDAWGRAAESLQSYIDAPPDHARDEELALAGLPDAVAATLRRLPTGKLRTAVINTNVHIIRSGGSDCGISAARLRGAPRLEVLLAAVRLHRLGDDESQMLAISAELTAS